jgi:hypothetical protein
VVSEGGSAAVRTPTLSCWSRCRHSTGVCWARGLRSETATYQVIVLNLEVEVRQDQLRRKDKAGKVSV